MWFQNFFKSLTSTSTPRRPIRRRPQVTRLSFEPLEDRCQPSFLGPVNYAAGMSPLAVVSADFNNDAVLDLAVANNGSGNVSVLLGNADGTFQPALTSATSAAPQSLAVGDFDGDGNLDLATANVKILRGNGDGTFQETSSISIADFPTSVAVGDFNGDGKLDLGVTSNVYYPSPYTGYYWYPGSWEGRANVLLGNGDGTFAAPSTTTVLNSGYYSVSAAVADFNGDGRDDFATGSSYGVSVLSANPDGSLQAPTSFYTAGFVVSVAARDVNGDGISDLVTANHYGVSALMGNGAAGIGNGTFQSPKTTALNFIPTSLAVGDINADGKLDLVTSSNFHTCTSYGYYGCYDGFNTGQVNVLLGHGNGAFASPTDHVLDAGTYASGIAVGDFNGDGWLDAVAANSTGNNVAVLINDQSWPPPPPPPPPSVSVNDVTVTEGNTGTVDATFTVTLSFASDVDVTVHYATANDSATASSDYTAASGDVIIPAGQTSRTVTVAVTGDRVAEPTETFLVNLSAPTNATIGDGQGIGTILDDEPLISINDMTVTEGNTGSVTATFTVTLSAASDVDVTVHYETANDSATAGSDYTAKSGDAIIPAGQLSRTLTVAVTGDRLGEPTETYFVNLSAPVNAGVADGQGVGTILDNEPRISINSVSVKEGNGGTKVMTFTVTLSAIYDQAVIVNYKTYDSSATAGSDYVAKSGTLTFAPGQTTKTFTVTIKGDKTKEADESFYVLLSGASSNALIDNAYGWGTIENDDGRRSGRNSTRGRDD